MILSLCSCAPELPDDVAEAYKKLPEKLDFNIHVKPILSDKCYLCHGPDKANQKAGLRLDFAESAYSPLPEHPRAVAIQPGKLSKSEVVRRILSEEEAVRMPTPASNLNLTAFEKATIIKWIEDGAEYKPHWAFIKPVRAKVPELTSKWANNPIDHFVLNKLEQQGFKPSKEANKSLLLRRLSFDLTGLPPSPEEITDFLADDSADAYEKQVDRLLASPYYGEKMATDWLDLARFADTHGYSVDRYRDMSPWRDWVIKAFNDNMPYQQFATWQIAGDLLPNATKEQKLATAFNRIHPQNMEGGIIPEEFRVEYVLDRTNTTGLSLMALTVSCARCHDHKYDPISQKEYYEMSSFYNNVNEAGQISYDNAMPVPNMLWTDEKKDSLLAMLEQLSDKALKNTRKIAKKEEQAFQKWISSETYQSVRPRNSSTDLLAHFTFDDQVLTNKLDGKKGSMKRSGSNQESPSFSPGKFKEGLLLDGDAWFDCANIGVFNRYQPFSVGLWVNIPETIEEGVILHKGSGAAIYNYKGFHLAIKNNQLELLMAHTTPDNAILEYAQNVPRNEWIHLAITYDGSSTAAGYKLFMNGKELNTRVEVDNLYKDIVFNGNVIGGEPGIQIGARWRGQGIGDARIDEVMIFKRALSALEILQMFDQASFQAFLNTPNTQLTDDQRQELYNYYLVNLSSTYQNALSSLQERRKIYADSVETIPEVMIMKEMAAPRPTYILNRGAYDAKGEQVFPNTPSAVLPWKSEYPKNRLGLAQWIFDKDHPLTARVAVNRYWQNYFGRGLVNTTEDFGNQGELPSHPELLDWLAIQFMESGWDVKALQKIMVMSAAYRQDSYTSPKMRELDPANIFLARGPTQRLSSEMVRDQALFASGLMVTKMGGKSVKPYQPAGLWSMNSSRYKRDSGDDLYRRSLYTFIKRAVPNPTLSTFDQPDRSECTVKRQKTNTPLQALVLLNDPTFVEASRALGVVMSKKETLQEGIIDTYIRLTGKRPTEEELRLFQELHQKEYAKFLEAPEKAKGWLEVGEYRPDSGIDNMLLAANTVVASVIMNSDASITKR
ncbi:MAG: DUF1553 domain-containing protein [Saprospiraceae bacterium]